MGSSFAVLRLLHHTIEKTPAGVDSFKELQNFYSESHKLEGLRESCAGVEAEEIDMHVLDVGPQDMDIDDDEHLVKEETPKGRIIKLRCSPHLEDKPLHVQKDSASGQ